MNKQDDIKEANLSRTAYLAEILEPEKPVIIVDIGANLINPAPYDQLADSGLAKVYGFEPQKSAYDKLMESPLENRVFLPYAIGDGQAGLLYECNHSGFTSLLKPNQDLIAFLNRWGDHMTILDEIEVETKRLDDIVELPPADFLKIDIQGGELAVFQNAHQSLKNVVAVMSEVAAIPIYEDQPLLHEQMAELHQLGFSLHKFDFMKNIQIGGNFAKYLKSGRHSSQLVDGDAVFIRSLLNLARLETEQLKHLALLSDAVFGSFDLVLKILQVLLEKGANLNEANVENYIRKIPHLRRVPHTNKPIPLQPLERSVSVDASAVIIAYNNASFVEKAVQSAINQTPKFEKIIVVDDCSTDGTFEVLQKVCSENSHVELVRHEVNSGPGAARNTGLEKVQSAYFCFLDGDDYFSEDMTAVLSKAITENQKVDMFAFKGMAFGGQPGEKPIGKVASGIYETMAEKKKVFLSVTFPWTKMYRTSWVLEEGIKFPVGKYEDIPWCYECIDRANKVVAIDFPIVRYRIHPSSTLQTRKRHQLEALEQWKRTFETFKSSPNYSPELARFLELNGFLQMSGMLLSKRIPEELESEFIDLMFELVGPPEALRTDFNNHPARRRGRRRLKRLASVANAHLSETN